MKLSDEELQKLIQRAKKLMELQSKILETDLDAGTEFFKKLLSDFYDGIREIREKFIEIPALPVDNIHFEKEEDVLEFLQGILNNEPFEEIEKKKRYVAYSYLFSKSEYMIKNKLPSDFTIEDIIEKADEDVLDEAFAIQELGNYSDPERYDELADSLFYEWFGPYDYVNGMLRAGSLLLKAVELPEHFDRVIETVKQCYAFQQYLAVAVLCRTAVEIAIRELYIRLGFKTKGTPEHGIAKNYFFEKRSDKKKTYPWEHDPWFSDMKEIICKLPEYEEFKVDIDHLYGNLSSIIHGNSVPNREKAEGFMRKTIWLIHDLYAVKGIVK